MALNFVLLYVCEKNIRMTLVKHSVDGIFYWSSQFSNNNTVMTSQCSQNSNVSRNCSPAAAPSAPLLRNKTYISISNRILAATADEAATSGVTAACWATSVWRSLSWQYTSSDHLCVSWSAKCKLLNWRSSLDDFYWTSETNTFGKKVSMHQ